MDITVRTTGPRHAANGRSAAYGEGVSPLVWLAIPLVALVAAVLWASWAARPRGPADPLDSVAAHHRFVEALERSRREPADGD
jgi:hypothetical protein